MSVLLMVSYVMINVHAYYAILTLFIKMNFFQLSKFSDHGHFLPKNTEMFKEEIMHWLYLTNRKKTVHILAQNK